MKPEERALLQERVRTLVLRHALETALERLGAAARAAGRDAEAELRELERALLAAARSLADRATVQKLSILAAVEDAAGTIQGAFDAAHTRLDATARQDGCAALAA
jgi:hypothetical protein